MEPRLAEKIRARWELDPYCQLLGVKVLAVAEGYARLGVRVVEGLRNLGGGPVQGGVLSSLVDIACGVALHTMVVGQDTAAEGFTTLDLNVSFLAAAQDNEIIAEGRIIRKGGTIAVGDVTIKDGAGQLVAVGRATYMVFKR